jgi:hypothetical protein
VPRKKKDVTEDENLRAFINAITPYVYKAAMGEYPNLGDAETKIHVKHALHEMWNCMYSIFEFQRPPKDLILIDYMAARYPWRSRRLTRSKHLEFLWFQFLNLNYLFKEKYRVCANRHNRLMEKLGHPHREEVTAGLKEIDKAIGKFIRKRGQYTHEWGGYHDRITALSSIEFISRHGDVDVTSDDESKHFRIARGLLREDIASAQKFMKEFVERASRGFVREYSAAVSHFNRAIEKSLAKQETRAN